MITPAFGLADTGVIPEVLRERRVPTAGVLGDHCGEAKDDPFVITVNQNTMGVVSVDLERGATERGKRR